jgi:hypothetical protein
MGLRSGDSRFDIRRGDVTVGLVVLFDGGEFQPMPDSRRMLDLMGSGELECSRSRNADLPALWPVMP